MPSPPRPTACIRPSEAEKPFPWNLRTNAEKLSDHPSPRGATPEVASHGGGFRHFFVGQVGNLPPMIIDLLLGTITGNADLTNSRRLPTCPTAIQKCTSELGIIEL